ncbi:MAG TPA: HD domain-containing protein [Verrucomicrobiae bacterium]|nr:HD domain-containing protein [Verrucomicrobiae bacterium]
MARPSISDLQTLLTEAVIPFYRIERSTPLRFAPGRHENDAEHSWSLALFACALASYVNPKMDVGKIAQFAIVHDLVEVHAGDTSNFAAESERATKDEREQIAFQRLQSDLAAFPWLLESIESYERQTSEEARFVKSIDKMLTLLIDYTEEGEFYKENHITIEQWRQKLQKQRAKASKHPGAFQYYDELWELLLANPHFFHQPKK